MVLRGRSQTQAGLQSCRMKSSLSPAALAPSCAAAGIRRRRSTSSLALPGLTLLLIATTPQANGSRAKRRHPSPNAGSRDPSAMYRPSLPQSSIPGVSIWTSKEAASRLQRRSSDTAAGAAAEEAVVASSTFDCEACVGGWIDEPKAGNGKTVRTLRPRNAQSSGDGAFGGDYQDMSGNMGDADVEPPSIGGREEEEIEEDEYSAEVLTTEEGEEEGARGNADAAPGRLLEEGGGSDSQEDESDDDDRDHDDSSDSFDDGDSESNEDDEDGDGVFGGGSGGFGKGDVVRGRLGRGLQQLMSRDGMGGEDEGGRGVQSLAKKYAVDEEACFARVKELWQERVEPPLSPAEMQKIPERALEDQKKLLASAPTEWNSGFGKASGGGAARRSRTSKRQAAEGQDDDGEEEEDSSSLELLRRLLVAEMQGQGASGGLNNRWIDRDSLLQLRGAATLAHHPEYLRHTANLPRVTRGVRLVAPEATHSMQKTLARSVGQSTGGKLLFLDSKVMDAVRGKALAEGIPKERLSSRQLTSALLELAGEEKSPFVIFLADKGSVALKSRGVCQRLTEELKSQSSRVLFLLSTASDPSVPGNPPPSVPGEDAASQEDASSQQQQRQQGGRGGMFGGSPQWPPPSHPKRSLQDGPKKNYIFLQQTTPSPDGGESEGYFGGRSPRSGSGSERGGRPASNRGQAPGQGFSRGMPGPPLPPQMLEQLLREAMKSMKAGEGEGEGPNNNNGDREGDGNASDHPGVGGGRGGTNGGSGDIPPGLLEALGEALNDDDFKNALEQIGKQLGKDMNQGFSIMFSTSPPPPGMGQKQKQEAGGEEDVGEGRDESSPSPWGAAGGADASAAGKAGSWQREDQGQSPPSLSWLTNLRKGIMSGVDEAAEGDRGEGDDEHDVDDDEDEEVRSAGGGSASGGKADSRRGVDLAPSSSEMRAFAGLFEDVAVDPPQDAILRQHWDAWIKEDVGRHNTKHNQQVLTTALRRNMLTCPDLKQLDPLLARHRLTEAETGQVILSALKVELSKAKANDAASGGAAVAGAGEERCEAGPYGVAPSQPLRTSKGRLVISRQSMETAFATVCKAHVPRPGQPMSRTREEVTALAQNDRHEQALVTNVILPKDIGVTYDMIGGLCGAKELLRQCITYPLRFPHLYNEGIAKEAVKGVLLFGPPGTGKTMLAKAVATEGGATFLSVDASVIENKWLGESEKNARAVFTLARRLAPCVVFIDEVDSVLSSREKYDDTTHGTLTSVKTTLMQEWDGLRTGGDRVVVIASTNRPFDLDEAVLRRLPRRILVDLPDAETREEILKVSMAQNRVDASVNFTAITAELEGFTGSDIKEVCREAVVRIAHEKAKELDKAGGGIPASEDIDLTAQLRPVTMDDFREARKKLTASVSEKGREVSRVWEWNEEYGEVKKKRSDASAHHLSMYT